MASRMTQRRWHRRGRPRTSRAVLALLIAYLLTGVSADELIDRVLAVAAGDVIMLSDVRAARELGLVPSTGGADPVRVVLSALIDRALMLNEVNRYAPPEPMDSAVDQAVNEVRARFSSPQALEMALARSGLTHQRLRETLRQNLRIRAYLEQRFAGDTRESVNAAMSEWLAGLRRRGDVVDLYVETER
jgi:hypothetical protein